MGWRRVALKVLYDKTRQSTLSNFSKHLNFNASGMGPRIISHFEQEPLIMGREKSRNQT